MADSVQGKEARLLKVTVVLVVVLRERWVLAEGCALLCVLHGWLR